MLDSSAIQSNLLALFSHEVDFRVPDHVNRCAWAFTNLATAYINETHPHLKNLINFDDLKLRQMISRFHRDAFGVNRFVESVATICPEKEKQKAIFTECEFLSIRINTGDPRKTRIAAAFSLWMSIMKPLYFRGLPSNPDSWLWSLEAQINFFIASRFLALYGTIEVGIEGEDRRVRFERIMYDFTYRDVNLSSLELLYCSVFRPHSKESQDRFRVPAVLAAK
jgi:hypothetical protein